jgi:hypothetical protein
MTDEEARAALDALIRDRREDYAGLSRLIGRNPAYIQQYVRRGTPRRLDERDRRILADYFGVAEAMLGAPASRGMKVARAGESRRGADLIAVPRLSLGASAGPGALAGEEQARSEMLFPPALLRELGTGRSDALSLIRVAGDSMQPTLGDGDDILVDGDDAADRLRDGIYVLRVGDALIVKRVSLMPDGGVAVHSDNPLSPDWSDVDRGALAVIGRVVWAGRRLR